MSWIVAQGIEIRTNDETKIVRFSQVEKFRDGHGYGCDLTVVSGGFSCRRPFYFDDVSLAETLPSLRSMATSLEGKCTIRGQYEADYVQLEVDGLGHVLVSGELIEHSELRQHLKFAFRTDQTVLLPLARELQLLFDA
jgi:hypothetical protein